MRLQSEALTSPESTHKKFREKWVDVRGRSGSVLSEDHDTNQRLKSNHSRDGDMLPWVGNSWSPSECLKMIGYLSNCKNNWFFFLMKLSVWMRKYWVCSLVKTCWCYFLLAHGWPVNCNGSHNHKPMIHM
jgi:hypothetical protein